MVITTIDIDTKDFERRMRKAAAAGPEAMKQELFDSGIRIFGESQRVVPVDTGTLKNSGGTEGPREYAKNKFEMIIFYGGAASDYALIVHEDLEAYHHPPTQAKYLEAPFIGEVQGIDTRMATKIAIALSEAGVT